jgi:hypothetical protein
MNNLCKCYIPSLFVMFLVPFCQLSEANHPKTSDETAMLLHTSTFQSCESMMPLVYVETTIDRCEIMFKVDRQRPCHQKCFKQIYPLGEFRREDPTNNSHACSDWTHLVPKHRAGKDISTTPPKYINHTILQPP